MALRGIRIAEFRVRLPVSPQNKMEFLKRPLAITDVETTRLQRVTLGDLE